MNEDISPEALKTFFRKDLFAGFVGIELLEAGAGRATARLDLRDHHLNGLGLVHGGAIFTLADTPCLFGHNLRQMLLQRVKGIVGYIKQFHFRFGFGILHIRIIAEDVRYVDRIEFFRECQLIDS